MATSMNATASDTTCAEYVQAYKSGNITNAYYKFQAGISDASMTDASTLRNKFNRLTDQGQGEMVMYKVALRCYSRPSTPLVRIIQVTL